MISRSSFFGFPREQLQVACLDMIGPGAKPALLVPTLAHLLYGVVAQRAITFKMRFAEELIGGRLVRKRHIGLSVVENICRLAAADRWLDINQRSVVLFTSAINF